MESTNETSPQGSGAQTQTRLTRKAHLVCLFALLMAAAIASPGHLLALGIPAPALASTAAAAPTAGGPVPTLSGSINLLENTRAIIKLDGIDTTPGATMTAYIIYISNAGAMFQVNPDGTRGAPIGVTTQLGFPVTNPNRLVWYEPNPDFFGSDGFQYYLKDNMGGESTLQFITISTQHVNQGPRALSTTHYGVNDATVTGIVLNVSDPDPGQQFQGKITQFPNAGRLYTSISLSPQSQLTLANPTFSGSQFFGIQLYYTFDNFPNPGTDAFSYIVNDGALSAPETTDFINIQLVTAPPTPGTTPPGWATIENAPLQITLTPVDPGGATSSLLIQPTSVNVHGTLRQTNLLGISQDVSPGNNLFGPQPDGTSWVMTYTPNTGFTTNGTPDTFSYNLTNKQGISSGPFTIQIDVLGPPNEAGCQNITISPGTVPGGNQNVPYAGVTFTATGGTGRLFLAEKGTLPAGMTFSNGTLSGTPTQSGSFPFFIIAVDINDCAQVTAYDLTILNPPPGISAQGPLPVPADGTVSLMPVAVVSDSAVAPGSLSVQATGVPPGLTIAGLKNTNGVVTAYVGAACHETPQMYSTTLQVSDGANNPVATTVVINVAAPQPGGPPLSYPAQVKVATGQSVTVKPVSPLPSGAAVSRVRVFNNGIGGYDGTAAVDQAGNVTLTGVGPSGASLTVIVTSLMGCSVSLDSAFTVVIPTYDKCLKDDSSGNFIQFNSQTGDYLLTVCGTGGFAVSGKGTVSQSGSVLILSDNQSDRRVGVSYLTNQLTGSATINLSVAPGVFDTIRIIQRRTNVTCSCS